MALDGAMLYLLRHEMEQVVLGAKIDKVSQPGKDEIILGLRGKGISQKLLISAGANNARLHFTQSAPENPVAPPMFCMLLRKHFMGARLQGIRQQGMDRILYLDFETTSELGDKTVLTLVVEIMGRHSNIIILDKDNKIVDSIKRIYPEMSAVRQILPGLNYALPPAPEKLRLDEAIAEQIVEKIRQGKDTELSKALLSQIEGLSPVVCREIAFYSAFGREISVSGLTKDYTDRLLFALKRLISVIRENNSQPVMICENGGIPKDLSFIDIHQYGHAMLVKPCGSFSELLDVFYSDRDTVERMKQKAHDLLKFLVNTSERLSRKIAAQKEELLQCDKRDTYKIYGDIISANLYSLQKGMGTARLVNFYDESMPEVEIPLNPQKSPAQNAQHYYAEYRKAATAEQVLTCQIQQGEQDLSYIDSVFDALTRAVSETELSQIREELTQQGFLKNRKTKGAKPAKLEPLKYRSSDGFLIYTGRNNLQNDKLTLRDSKNQDIWLHVKNIPGSHTIVVTEGKPVPDNTLTEAACIAAYNSKARDSAQVPVDYTAVKNVKKPNGAKPGMVIYEVYKTLFVTPDGELVKRLSVQ